VSLIASLLAALAVALLLGRGDGGRLAVVLPSVGISRGAGPEPSATQARGRFGPGARLPPPLLASLVLGAALSLLVAWPLGPLLGLTAAVAGPRLLAGLEPARERQERERLQADLPLLLDLLAACLAGGAPLPGAASAVGAAIEGPAGRRLQSVAAALDVGMPPGEAWALLAGTADGRRRRGSDTDDALAAAARALARAADGGAPVAAAVTRLATETRAAARSRGEQAARRVGVLAVAPLGLCFLPAFVLLGVVPVVVGLAAPLLASL